MATSKVTVYFSCPVERLWYAVTDLTNTGWRSDLTGVEIRDEAHFVEHGRSGRDIHFTVTDCEPPHFWAFTMENSSMSGSWEGSFESAEGGSRLSCTETVTSKSWWMRPFVSGYLKRQQKLYLDNLRKEVLK